MNNLTKIVLLKIVLSSFVIGQGINPLKWYPIVEEDGFIIQAFEKVKIRLMHEEILANKIPIEDFIKEVKNKNLETDFFYFTEFGIIPEPSFITWYMLRGLEKKDSMDGVQKLKNKPKILFLGSRFLNFDPSWRDIVNNNFKSQRFSLRLIDRCQYLQAFQLLDINESKNSQLP